MALGSCKAHYYFRHKFENLIQAVQAIGIDKYKTRLK